VLSVLAFHYTVRWAPATTGLSVYPWGDLFLPAKPLSYAWAGVELFFLVSGFVIAMTLEAGGGALGFLRSRLARLWPALAVCAALTMAIAPFGPAEWRVDWRSYFANLTFVDPGLLRGWLGPRIGWVDGVYWTLWVEVRFYVLAVVLFSVCRRRFVAFACAAAGLSFVAGLRGVEYPGRGLAWLVLLPTFLPYFVFGAAAWRLRGETRPTASTLTALGLCALMILVQGWTAFEYPAGGPIGFGLINVAMLTLMLLIARSSPLVAFLGCKPLARLGEASYSLYLIHSVAGLVLIHLMSQVLPWPLALALVSTAMVGYALICFTYVERPGRRLVLRLLGSGAGTSRPSSIPAFRGRDPSRLMPTPPVNGR
jgi:peptidoglycan/LPS O-acetylase OafA/YrhL